MATFPPQTDHVLADLFSSMAAGGGGPAGGAPLRYSLFLFSFLEDMSVCHYFIIENDVSCEFFKYSIYHVEEVPFYY